MRRELVVLLSIVAVLEVSETLGLEFGNGRLLLRFDDATGALVDVRYLAGESPVRLLGGGVAPVDVHADAAWRFSAKTPAVSDSSICLDGEWDFRVEAGEWRRLRVPGFWEAQGVTQVVQGAPDPNWTPYNGSAYYRTTFVAPAAWRDADVRIVIDGVDDEDWTRLNGREIGHTGMEVENWWSATRSYAVPRELLKVGVANVLEVKVYDRGGDGGIAGSVFVGPAAETVTLRETSLTLVSHELLRQGGGDQVLTMALKAPGWDVETVTTLPREGSSFTTSAEWRYVGEGTTSVTCLRFNFPAVCIGEPRDCVYTLPGRWPPGETPLSELNEGRMARSDASGAVPAAVVVHNSRHQLGLCAALYTEDDWTGLIVREGKESVDVHAEVYSHSRLRTGESIRLGTQVVTVTAGTLADGIAATAQCWELAGFRLAARPDWTYGAALYSLWAGGSVDSASRDLGGLRNFQTHVLPRLHDIGFDVVWFNPINPGSYAPTRHRDVDPRHGTLDDLKAVCDDAHGRGMRIWLDLIPHGPREHSPDGQDILEHHPEWLSRNADGSVKYWWGCLNCDYAHPGWQAEMADVATFFVERCGIDGWRVDCAAGSPDNERPYAGLRPSQSGPYGALGLLRKVREELTAAKPEAALLGETGSAMHLAQCDFVYDWSFQRGALHALPQLPVDEWVGKTKLWLERQQAALPDDAALGLLRFLENHDQFRSMRRYGVGHERALLSLCALIPGLVFVFNEQDSGFGLHLQRLFAIRRFPEFSRGAAFYTATECSAPSVFAFTRVHGDGFAVAAINFAGQTQEASVTVPLSALGSLDMTATYSAVELYEGQAVGDRRLDAWQDVSLRLPAYGTRVVVLRPLARRIATPTAGPATVPPGVARQPSVSRDGADTVVENGLYRARLRGGLLGPVVHVPSGVTLFEGLAIAEGKRKIWPGQRVEAGQLSAAQRDVESSDGTTTVRFQGSLERGAGSSVAWEATYRFDNSPSIGVELVLEPPAFERPVRGQLGVDLVFGRVDAWQVNTIEGVLHDRYAMTHPAGDMLLGYRYWHRSGLLWESTLFPLDEQQPTVAVRSQGTWLRAALPPLVNDFENAYLRERSSAGDEALTLHLAWLDEKGIAKLDRPLRAAVSLQLGAAPTASAGALTGAGWSLNVTGSRYGFRNSAYELAVCRGLGGGIAHLSTPSGRPAIVASQVYSDSGIYESRENSTGTEVKTQGASKCDFEPDTYLTRDDDAAELRLNSFLRMSYWGWANVASPRVQYEVRYRLDSSRRIRTRCRVRPMLAKTDLRAFLAQTLSIVGVKSWRVGARSGPVSGSASAQAGVGRVWQSREQALAERGGIDIDLVDGRQLRFSGFRADGGDVQNVFLLDTGRGNMILFLAFLDGTPESLEPVWRPVEYTMELLEP